MPQMDGIEATLAIRAAEKAAGRGRVPIIAVTANPDKSLCLNADMDDFLFKPVMLPELEQIMKKWVGLPKLEPQSSDKSEKSETHRGSASPTTPIKSIEPQFGFAAAASASDKETLVAAEGDVPMTAAETPVITDAAPPADNSGNVIE